MLQTISIDPDVISRHYRLLNKIGAIDNDISRGFLRSAYSEQESQALQYIEQCASDGGLNHRYDAVGNLIVETPGHFTEWVETGSHIDTVAAGGNYDGAAGIIAGIEALLTIHHSAIALQRGLRLRIWRGEESASFGITSIGSRAAFGQLPPRSLQARYRGFTLADAMLQAGTNPAMIATATATIDQSELDSITAFIEMHIEQGKVLESQNREIGIVTAIRGSKRSWIRLNGAFDHSGATPMGNNYRSDTNLAMAYMQVRLDQLLSEQINDSPDLVQTVGCINSNRELNIELSIHDNAVSKVSGTAYFSHEVRGCDAVAVDKFCELAFTLIQQTAAEFAIQAQIETFSDQSGIAALDSSIQKQLAEDCEALGLNYSHLASGAWHDAGVVARQKRSDGSSPATGMIFIPCRGGISHSPDEYASADQIAAGASLLATTIFRLAQ